MRKTICFLMSTAMLFVISYASGGQTDQRLELQPAGSTGETLRGLAPDHTEWSTRSGSTPVLARGEESRGPDGGLIEAVGGSDDDDDVFYDMTKTSDGGVVAVGYTASFGAGGEDVLLVKFDDCGDFVWEKTLGGTGDEVGHAVIELLDGDLVVTGYTSSVGGAGDHLFISRFTESGVENWTTVLTEDTPLIDYETRGYDVIRDTEGRFVVTGTVWNTDLNQYSLLLARFDSDGSLLDKAGFRVLGLPNWDHWGESLVEGCGGEYLVVGGSTNLVDRPVFLLRIDANMNIGWARWLREGDDDAVGHSITLDRNTNPLMTGSTGDDLFVSKLNCNGSLVAGRQKKIQLGTTAGHGIIELSSEPYELLVTGEYGSQVLVSRWTADFDLVGGFRTWGSDGNELGYSVVEDTDQRLWIAGETSSWGAGGQDGLLAKLDADGHTCTSEEGHFEVPADWSPTESTLTISSLPLSPLEETDWAVDSSDVEDPQQYFECDDECVPPVPTLPEWGAVAMALLLLTAGTVVFYRRRAGHA